MQAKPNGHSSNNQPQVASTNGQQMQPNTHNGQKARALVGSAHMQRQQHPQSFHNYNQSAPEYFENYSGVVPAPPQQQQVNQPVFYQNGYNTYN